MVWIMEFYKADSRNLPLVLNVMILEYMSSSDSHNIAEIRGAKALLASRSSYLETAVGYVKVGRTSNQCVVRAEIVFEHRVRTKNYKVTAILDECNQTIISTECDSCAAAAGGCKHSLVLLFWLEKKTMEPSSTEVKCYWSKPKLKESLEPARVKELYNNPKSIHLKRNDPSVLNQFISECKKHASTESLVYLHSGEENKISYNLYDIAIDFVCKEKHQTFKKFFNFVNNIFCEEVIKLIQEQTVLQAQSKLWHNVRQGRITGTKIYEASVCNTDGTLFQQILGGYKVPETQAIRRGKTLEKVILKHLQKDFNIIIHECGIILINGIIGASPDGICDNFVLEIKCPTSMNTFKNYVKDGIVRDKFMAQIQLQMYAAHKNKGLFCVADPSYETNKKLHLFWVDLDEDLVKKLIDKSLLFWEQKIYPKILDSAQI